MGNPTRRIAVCIDDFGLHAGVNAAALELVGAGRVNVVSCMVGAPQWRTGAPALAQLPAAQVDVGLHLDLSEYPLARSNRRSLAQLMALSVARLLDPARIRAEIDAQLDTFEQVLGRTPDHVDGHQHVHQFPVIREALVQALAKRYPGRPPWLRSTRRPHDAVAGGFKPWLIERLGCEALARLARKNGHRQNGHLLGIYDFQGDSDHYLALISQWLAQAMDGDLLMCHASLEATAQDPILGARRNEYQVLRGDTFGELMTRASVQLAPLSLIAPRE